MKTKKVFSHSELHFQPEVCGQHRVMLLHILQTGRGPENFFFIVQILPVGSKLPTPVLIRNIAYNTKVIINPYYPLYCQCKHRRLSKYSVASLGRKEGRAARSGCHHFGLTSFVLLFFLLRLKTQ